MDNYYDCLEEHDILLEDSIVDADTSFLSEPDITPKSCNFNFSNGSPLNSDDFHVVHYNINSITAEDKLDQLQEVAKILNISVLICTESKLDESIPNTMIMLPGFHEPIRHDRNRHGGGCLIYIAESLNFKEQKYIQSEKYEHISVDLKIGLKIVSINCLYRPPSYSNHEDFLNEAEMMLNNLSNHNADIKIIASDLNFGNIYSKYPTLPPKPLDSSAPDLFASHGFLQLIDIPTRITEKTTSLVDLIFVSKDDHVQCHGTLPPIADHDGVVVSLDIKKEKVEFLKRHIFDYKNVDEKGLIKFFKDYDYESTVFDLPYLKQTEAFTNIVIEGLEKFVPVKSITTRTFDVPWQNSYTRLLLRKKNRNYSIYKKINSSYLHALDNPNSTNILISTLKQKKEKAFAKCKSSSLESTKANRRTKKAFFTSVNNIMHNAHISAKKKFNILKNLMKNQKVSSIPQLIKDDLIVNDPLAKSNILNDIFNAKATVQGNLDPVPILPVNENIRSPLSNLNTSPIEVAKLCRDIKKSNSSFCGIPGKFLSLIATPISFPLYKLLNNMFEHGHFPDLFKISHITPIWKKSGSKSDPAMYRPISLLPTLSKIMESIMHKRLLDHLIENDIINHRQAAYLKGDSTVQQLLYIVHQIKKMWTKGNITQGVFLDVSAAFDKCWHSGLIAKLKQNKIDGNCLTLFESYLRGRKQIVVVDGVKSQMREIEAGIPQGSRLGPLLWILYVNDLLDNLESEALLFALNSF